MCIRDRLSTPFVSTFRVPSPGSPFCGLILPIWGLKGAVGTTSSKSWKMKGLVAWFKLMNEAEGGIALQMTLFLALRALEFVCSEGK